MPTKITKHDKEDFAGYLRNLTDAQVIAVEEKERKAGRRTSAALAAEEAARRGLKP
jgi:hypothetical protein